MFQHGDGNISDLQMRRKEICNHFETNVDWSAGISESRPNSDRDNHDK
jgi:hypothetical protein